MVIVLTSVTTHPVWAVPFTPTNLVSDDQAANPAQITDPVLTNAWGLSYSPSSPFWISANGSGTSPLYNVNPADQTTAKQALTVSIPGGAGVTGQVFNPNTTSFNGNLFLFVSQNGSVSGWRPSLGTSAELIAPVSTDNVYTGAAIGNVAGNDYLYAANFKSGGIDVYKGTASAPSLTGSFTDPTLPSGYAPFNIQTLNDALYVAYAQRDSTTNDEIVGAGKGFVDKFALDGTFMERIASNGELNAPWGLAIAPSSFGSVAGDLLVGNFGDGRITAYDTTTHVSSGQVLDASNQPLTIDGLWAIAPGNGAAAGNSNLLYFTAGPNGETHGVFGVLTPIPEPSTYAMMLVGLGLLGLLARRRELGLEDGIGRD
jgi:uncharacterized protein (TIGR03118 family)